MENQSLNNELTEQEKVLKASTPVMGQYTYIISEADRIYLFSPITRTYARINKDLYDLLQECNGNLTFEQIMNKLKLSSDTYELFKNLLLHKLITTKNNEQLCLIPEVQTTNDVETRFNHVTIFPTNNCNLKCRYCYAHGGDNKNTINYDYVTILFDWFFNQLHTTSNSASLSFHGGGEPTVAFSIVEKASIEFRKRCENIGIEANISIVSNGTFSKAQGDWLLKNGIYTNFSVDGPPDIQDYQRPFRSGKASSNVVYKNIKKFIESGRDVPVRVTVTNTSVAEMIRITQFLIDLGVSAIHLEPCFFVGRCYETGESEPDVDQFIDLFVKCFLLGLDHDVDVTYSGLRCTERSRDRFCGACGENIAVTPDGYVTACYEVVSSDDPAADVFEFGTVNDKLKKLELDNDKIQYLRERTGSNLHMCKTCFLLLNCAGDCPIKTFRDTGSLYKPSSKRCKMATEINKKIIMQIADGEIVPRDTSNATRFTFGTCPE